MNKQRLLKLADHLMTVPVCKFDMRTFGNPAGPMRDEPQCVTRACALGWATSIPEFARAGLKLVWSDRRADMATVLFRNLEDFDAAEKFFDLNDEESTYLFAEGATTPKNKAKEIREFVRSGGVIPQEEYSAVTRCASLRELLGT